MGAQIVRLGYLPPYRFEQLLSFFRVRALAGVEAVGNDFYLRTVRIPLSDGGEARGWMRIEDDPSRNALAVTLSESLLPALPQVIARVRRQFDVDCDPYAIHDQLASINDVVPHAAVLGTRLPGCFDPFETATRAVLGQQVSVSAANRLAARLVEAYGTPADFSAMPSGSTLDPTANSTCKSGALERQTANRAAAPASASDETNTNVPSSAELALLTRFFPTPTEMLAISPIEDALGQLGIIKTRSRTIAEIARLLEAGELDFGPGANAPQQMERLLTIKGIGPWTANYIAMRTMSYSDAFLETDAGIKHALPELTPKERLALAEQWRPWRSYANICLWNSLG